MAGYHVSPLAHGDILLVCGVFYFSLCILLRNTDLEQFRCSNIIC